MIIVVFYVYMCCSTICISCIKGYNMVTPMLFVSLFFTIMLAFSQQTLEQSYMVVLIHKWFSFFYVLLDCKVQLGVANNLMLLFGKIVHYLPNGCFFMKWLGLGSMPAYSACISNFALKSQQKKINQLRHTVGSVRSQDTTCAMV